MAKEQPLFIESCVAGADLRNDQYHYVTLGTDGLIVESNEADLPYGILQDKPNTGQAGAVMRCGVSKVQCAADSDYADRGGADDNGLFKVNATHANAIVIGEADGANGFATVSFNCMP